MKYPLCILCLIVQFAVVAGQPKREVRAAWLTTQYGLDWPRTRATSPASVRKQQEELRAILDALQEAHFNTILFQTRTRGDVFYRSEIEPLSARLANGDPGYDPLAFVVEECHKRGMECHAWMVAIPLGTRRQVQSLGNASVVKRQPAICLSYGGAYYLNPGHPQTKEYLMSLVREVVSRYDVDGVHFDYLRYPERAPRFPDQATWRRYGKGVDLSTWRRENLTAIMRRLYDGIKQLKPWVKVSSSPIGKFRDTTRYPSQGWNAYYTVGQDVQGWLREGIQDQIYPMLYFRGDAFYPFVLDWQENSYGRQVVAGLGTYFLDEGEGDWPAEELERQIHYVRRHGLAGEAHFRASHLTGDVKGIYRLLKEEFYVAPALPPAMPWIDAVPPSAPARLSVSSPQTGYYLLEWEAVAADSLSGTPTYVVYASDTFPVDTANPSNIVAQGIRQTSFLYAPRFPWEAKRYFAVTAVDRCGNESHDIRWPSHP
ncbi:MAG: family 10 glycosylhydrolase [Prevotellaceae bacterium]|jgi:uncharacterized lipoprotein YddW (UPF0748 family)|nr:family 10 glycosylhydrolase [Prevotellaceae bacterium]